MTDRVRTSAWAELLATLRPGEEIEAVVFGEDGGHVPVEFQNTVLSAEKARPWMESWSFFNEYAEGYPQRTVIWTNARVLHSMMGGEECSWLVSVPRHPAAITVGLHE